MIAPIEDAALKLTCGVVVLVIVALLSALTATATVAVTEVDAVLVWPAALVTVNLAAYVPVLV